MFLEEGPPMALGCEALQVFTSLHKQSGEDETRSTEGS